MKSSKNIPSLFDEHHKLQKLKKYKDPLIVLNEKVNWESFRHLIESAFPKHDPSVGGRPAFDKVMMFKVLILQKYYELSDDAIEYQIVDRWSFIRFLGLSMNDKVPDAKTIWLFRETLTKAGILDSLFEALTKSLHKNEIIVKGGRIVDASIMEAPRQRNSRDENKQIKGGGRPEGWSENKSRQKDTDAAWTKKGGKNHFGYKNHIVVDEKTKLITDFEVTPANVTDREVGMEFIPRMEKGTELYGDKGYPSEEFSKEMANNKLVDKVMKKGCRNSKLSESDEARNREISPVRCKVEHVFGFQKRNKNKFDISVIGLDRATAQITLKNIVYNIKRGIKLITMGKLHICLGV
jgi:IS5 family transposase